MDPQDLSQWRFWVVSTDKLHAERKSIGLQPLIRASGEGISYEELPARIEALRPSVLRPSEQMCQYRRTHGFRGMGIRLRRSLAEDAGFMEPSIEEWPYLDEGVLRPSRSRKVCLTCHFFRHHAGTNCCIPLLSCQLHQGLLAQGEHLTHSCQGWTDDMTRQRGWCPEVA